MKDYMKLKYVTFILALFFIGFSIVLTTVAFVKGDIGSVADWVSGLGSVFAIVAVYQQIKQSDRQYQDNKKSSLKIATGTRKEKEIIDGGISYSSNREIYFWAVNTGNVPDSFIFIGVCLEKDYKKIINTQDELTKMEYLNEYIREPFIEVALGLEKREFEIIQPHQISKEIVVPVSYFSDTWPEESKFCIVFMSAVGELYKKDVFTKNNKSA
ncbi:hypothetical protein FH621_01610 [Latilactobacillus curvatus]|uniref:hypothetical protein n=1 Tax=Latilactobacillus curvatus TaxID=28038 RepID=UPI00217E8F17|nr:hypothetical protein [Latilactobacillus curvatus]MCS6142258.1 hypothetical protein [Latilactobacillus curvatus]